MSKHIQELSQAEASSASDSESDNGVSIPGAENSDFFSDEDESLILSTDGKKNISTISDHKGIETNLSLEFLQSELKKSRKEIEELREVTEKRRGMTVAEILLLVSGYYSDAYGCSNQTVDAK